MFGCRAFEPSARISETRIDHISLKLREGVAESYVRAKTRVSPARRNRKVATRTYVCVSSHTIARATKDTLGRGIFLTSLLGIAYLRSCSERRIPNTLFKVASHSPKDRSASIHTLYAQTQLSDILCVCAYVSLPLLSLSLTLCVRANEMLPHGIPQPVLNSMVLDDIVAARRQFSAPIDCYFVFPIKAGRLGHNEMLSSRATASLFLSLTLSCATLRGTSKYSTETRYLETWR